MIDYSGQSIGRYHIIEQLGVGGMATVYKAFDTSLERDVAVKFIRRDAFPKEISDRIIKRFEREAKALARLAHSNIVRIYDYGEYKGSPYLVMEYIAGGTLKAFSNMPMAIEQVVHLLLPLARALEYAHEENLIHRDVKPANILISRKGQPMLSDFGITKILDLNDSNTLTGANVGMGTPEYMAPEQGLGRVVDARADVYSLGVMMFELVTGHKPYEADTPMAVVLKHVSDPLPRPGDFVPTLPAAVEQVLYKAMAKKPEDRYQNMGDFATALEKLVVHPDAKQENNISPMDTSTKPKPMKGMTEINASRQTHDATWDSGQPVKLPISNPGRIPAWAYLLGGVILFGLVVALLASGGWPTAVPGKKTPTSLVHLENKPADANNPTEAPRLTEISLTPTETQEIGSKQIPDSDGPNILPTPGGRLIFSENFEDGAANGFDFYEGNWKVVDDGSENKVLEGRGKTSAAFGPSAFSDGIVEFRLRVVSADFQAQNHIVVFNLRNQVTLNRNWTTYPLSYDPVWNGLNMHYQEKGDPWQPLEDIYESGSLKKQLGDWIFFRVEAHGKDIKVFVDGLPIITGSDSRDALGGLTLGAHDNLVVHFDDINVWDDKEPK